MKRLTSLFARGRSRVALLGLSVFAIVMAALPAMASAAGEPTGTSGKEIAESFVSPLTTKFTEALPVIVGFLVLVAATVAIIKFVQSRGKSKTV
jgi:ABC-type Na+ efflux pump permease subunit